MIRDMTADDLPVVKQIIDTTGLFPSEMLDDMAAAALGGAAPHERWLVIEDESPIGVAYVAPEQMTEGTWNLYLIAIHADRQGYGTGTQLISQVEKMLADEGQRVLLVETSGGAGFKRTRQFYLNNGYTQEARIREFYTAGGDKIIFWKKL